MKPTGTRAPWVLSICAALLATSATADIPSAADACLSDLVETTPSGDFTVLGNGEMVRHEPTGLEWRRCVEGMSWTGTGCAGTASTWTWHGALQHADAVSGWRLPNINELRSIVERCKAGPAVNEQVFPGTPSVPAFWSASPYAGEPDRAWFVYFSGGSSNWLNLNNSTFGVRLVRTGWGDATVVHPGESYAGVTFGPNGTISVDETTLFESISLGITEEPNFDYFYLRVYETGAGIRIVELYEIGEYLTVRLDDTLLATARVSAEGDILEEVILQGN